MKSIYKQIYPTFIMCLVALVCHGQQVEYFSNHDHINALFFEENRMWAATGGGLLELDLTGKLLKKHTVLDGIITAKVSKVMQLPDKKVLIENGLFGYDRMQVYEQEKWVVHTESKNRRYLFFESNKAFGYIDYNKDKIKIYDNNQWKTYNYKEDIFKLKRAAVLDNQDNLWISYKRGAIKYDKEKQETKIYQFMSKYGEPNFLLKDKKGNLWALDYIQDTLCYYDRSEDKWTICESDTCKLISGSRFAFSDAEQNIWFTNNRGNILYKYDGTQWEEITVPFRDLFPYVKDRNARDWLHCGGEDKAGNLWFGTYYGNLYKYDGKDWTFINLSQSSPYFFDGNMRLEAIHLANDKSIWLANLDYISKIGLKKEDNLVFTKEDIEKDASTNFTYYHLATEQMIEDGAGNMYIRPQKGVFKYDKQLQEWSYIFDRQDISFMHYSPHQKAIYFLNDEGMLTKETNDGEITFQQVAQTAEGKSYIFYRLTHVDKSGNLWLAYNDNLHCITADTTLTWDGEPSYIYEDSKGRVWIDKKGGGIAYWDGKKWNQFNKKNSPIRYAHKLGYGNKCLPIVEDKSGNIWVRSAESIYKWDGKSWVTHRLWRAALKDKRYTGGLFIDSKENIWVLDQRGELVKCKGTECEQVPSSGDGQYIDVLEDSQGKIWFLMKQGGLLQYTN